MNSKKPTKKKLKELYNSGLTQKEIGSILFVDYRTVIKWMQDYKIKSRGILHIVKSGKDNPQWKGEKASYAAMHYRVANKRGKPKKCEECGTTDESKSYDWACIGDYKNINNYKRMCRSCHFRMDKIHISRKMGINKRNEFNKRITSHN